MSGPAAVCSVALWAPAPVGWRPSARTKPRGLLVPGLYVCSSSPASRCLILGATGLVCDLPVSRLGAITDVGKAGVQGGEGGKQEIEFV